jgi:NADPH-dependent 2,4-dienoyl-CoA reductase/sulfur reductase-like enzyme
MTPSRVVIIGSSLGGIRAAQALRAGGFAGELIVAGAEKVPPYDRPPLSKQVLTGDETGAGIALLRAGDDFELRLGRPATGLDTVRRQVILDGGEPVGYDAAIIATGVRARTLPGTDRALVRSLRELADAVALRDRLARGEPVVVIGGGFIGAEVAAAAVALGCPVTIIESLPAPFCHVLGTAVGSLLGRLHATHGVTVLTNATVTAVEGLRGGGALIRLADGRVLEAGTVVAGVGAVPNTEWLAGSGVPLDDGVRTDEHCAVPGAPGLYAIGDVARRYDPVSGVARRVEHWTNAVEQANLVAHRILRPDQPRPRADVPYFWSDQYGVKIQMIGRAAPGDSVEVLRCGTPAGDRHVALYSSAGRFAAAVTFGWPKASMTARQAWQRGAQTADVKAAIIALSGGLTSPVSMESVAGMKGS